MGLSADQLNFKHLRAVLEVSRAGGLTQASGIVHLSQPAITYAIKTLEDKVKTSLFLRGPGGMVPTAAGEQFARRVDRALSHLNNRLPKSNRAIPTVRIERRASAAQLRTLIAIGENGSYSVAARALGLSQPTVYRAAHDLEAVLGLTLFETSANAVRLTRPGERIAQNARLAFAEIEQALLEIEEARIEGGGQVRIGALPLARATFLSPAIDRAFKLRPALRVLVDDGRYSDLLLDVRNGALDFLVGALRDPLPASDIIQELLFEDRLGVYCGPGHPLLAFENVSLEDLRGYPWVVPRLGTPTRQFFQYSFADLVETGIGPLIETSSMILIRELLQSDHRLTLISKAQISKEVRQGLVFDLQIALDDTPRPIGLAFRKDWHPTEAQRIMIEALRAASQNL
jgi:DNA-binding transcriptional LysR family regulator